MAALLTSVCDEKEKVQKYIESAKNMGMKILPPDVNISEYGFINEGENGLRYGLGSIKTIGYINIENLVKSRPFNCISDLITKTEKRAVNKKVLTALALSGSLDTISNSESAFKPKNRLDILQYILNLREDKDELNVEDFTEEDELQYEVDYLGMYLSKHPLDGIADPIKWDKLYCNVLFDCTAIVLGFREILTKTNKNMAFVDIECLEGRKNVVVFPNIYQKTKSRIKENNIITLTMKKQYRGSDESFIVENIKVVKKK